MSDTLRALAAEHPELLTVECPGTIGPGQPHGWWHMKPEPGEVPRAWACPLCNGTGRRLQALDELLAAAAEIAQRKLDQEGEDRPPGHARTAA